MKLAIVYDAVYPFVRGGGERRYYELAVRLARAGHDVHWYGMRYWDGPRTWRNEGVTYHGVCRPRRLYTDSGRRSILQALLFGVATLRLVARRYDAVDCCAFPYFSTFAARLAVGARGGTLVSTWHEFWGGDYWRSYLGRGGWVGERIERAATRMPAHIIAVSAPTAVRLEQARAAVSVTVLPNGVDGRALQAVAPTAATCDVIYVGRLCDYKDVELLLSGIAKLTATRPSLRCKIVGDGPHRPSLEAFVARHRLADRVQFTGAFASSDDVYAAMAGARVLVLPSRREGFGIVVVEANALGVPAVVVAHPHNDAVALVAGENGLVSSPDASALAMAIDQILSEPPLERVDACRAFARRFDWDEIALQYERLLSGTAA